MRTRRRRRRLNLSPFSVDGQRKQRESDEYEQKSGSGGNGLAPGTTMQEGADRCPRRGVTRFRAGVHRARPGSGSGITIRQR
jgi:hypothetical protein